MLALACGGTGYHPPASHRVDSSTSYPNADYDGVWEAVIETMAQLQYPITNMEKASGLVATDWMIFPRSSSHLDCGWPGRGERMGDRWGRFNVFVRQSQPPLLTVNTNFRTQICSSDGCYTVQCTSTGILEQSIQDLVRNLVSE
jgi:hypothetical protein